MERDSCEAAVAREYFENGYAVVRVMSIEEAGRVEKSINKFLDETPDEEKVVTDEAGSLGPQPKRSDVLRKLHSLTAVLASEGVRAAVAEILGGHDLVLDTCRLMTLEPGQRYCQGFHRDVPPSHVVDEKHVRRVLEENAKGRWYHNVVQCTLALAPEESYWCIPGSHARLYTPEELVYFDGANRDSSQRRQTSEQPSEGELQRAGRNSAERLPLYGSNSIASGVNLPGAVPIKLEPGQLLLQHNLLIHRGWAGPATGDGAGTATTPRRAFQFAFHAARRPPTWHFRRTISDDYDSLGPQKVELVGKQMCTILERRARRMQEHIFRGYIDTREGGDEAWRSANCELFFSGGLCD